MATSQISTTEHFVHADFHSETDFSDQDLVVSDVDAEIGSIPKSEELMEDGKVFADNRFLFIDDLLSSIDLLERHEAFEVAEVDDQTLLYDQNNNAGEVDSVVEVLTRVNLPPEVFAAFLYQIVVRSI